MPKDMSKEDRLLQVMAQTYCNENNSHKPLDATLLRDMGKDIRTYLKSVLPEKESCSCDTYTDRCDCGFYDFNRCLTEVKARLGLEE